MNTTSLMPNELEHRRCLAVQRINQGYSQSEVADFLGVDSRSVRRWLRAYRLGGWEALKAQPRSGRPRKLTPHQEAIVLEWFQHRPTKFGFSTDLWTAARVAQLIRQRFGVSFNPRYISAWLTERAITPQKPQRIALERDPERIAEWLRDEWPRILKKGPTKTLISC